MYRTGHPQNLLLTVSMSFSKKRGVQMSLAFYPQGGIAYNVIALTSTTRQTLLSQRRLKDSPFSKPCENGLSFLLGLIRKKGKNDKPRQKDRYPDEDDPLYRTEKTSVR